jgi:hypothetical protein
LFVIFVFMNAILSLHYERLILSVFLLALILLFLSLALFARELRRLRNRLE